MEEAVLPLDLGASSCKGGLYSPHGDCLTVGFAEYAVSRAASNIVEQDPQHYLEAAQAVVMELTKTAAAREISIAAIGLTTQTPTLIFCDELGAALAPAIIWQDTRAGSEQMWLLNNTTAEQRRRWLGLDLDIGAASIIPKLLWMKNWEPSLWAAMRWILQPKDYVIHALTGQFVTDRWCALGLANVDTGEVDEELLNLLGKSLSPCPRVLSAHATAGEVSLEAARKWSIPVRTRVCVGLDDGMSGILATGALHNDNRGFVIAGTSEVVGVSHQASERVNGLLRSPGNILAVHLGLELHYGPTQAGAGCLEWLGKILNKSNHEMTAMLKSRGVERPSSILFQPYLYGERAPYWNHKLCARFEGLRAEHDSVDLVHAVLQGVALQERLILELAERGRPVDMVALGGGAARSEEWNQIRADILQRKLLVIADSEVSLRGAAMVAWGHPLGLAGESWLKGKQVDPNTAHAGSSNDLMRRFEIGADDDA